MATLRRASGPAITSGLLSLVLLAGCGGQSTGHRLDALYHQALPVEVQPPDPCHLLGPQDASDLLGASVPGPQHSAMATALPPAQRDCVWQAHTTDAYLGLTVSTDRAMTAARQMEEKVAMR